MNPTVFIKNTSSPRDWYSAGGGSAQDNKLWNTSSSTVYDPCPKGYHVPSTSLWSGVTTSNWDRQTDPLRITYGNLTYTSGGYRSLDGGLLGVGSCGYYGSGAVEDGFNNVFCLYFESGVVYPASAGNGAPARGVRCVQN